MKKFLKWKPNGVILLIILSVVLLVALIPLIRLALYSIPWYDDYNYATYTRSFRLAYGDNFINAIRGIIFQVHESWWAWQGTFASIFLMALCPIGWGEEYYRYGVIALIVLFVISLVFCVYAVMKKVFGIKTEYALSIALITAIVAIEKMYFPGHGFYWFNGGVHYIGIESFLFLLLGSIIMLMDKKGIFIGIIQGIITTLLAVIVSGGNFVTVLQGALLLIPLLIFSASKYGLRALRMLPVTIAYAVGMYFNMIAPGNNVRAKFFVGMTPFDAVKNSFPEGLKRVGKFSDALLIIVLLMIVPMVIKGVKESRFKFKFPLIPIAYAAGVYFATYTPNLYGTGAMDLARVLNICQLTYQLALVFAVVYFVGWLARVIKEKKSKLQLDFGFWWYYVCGVVIVFVFFAIGGFDRYEFSSYGAYVDVKSGEAAALYQEYEDRIDMIKAGGDDVTVPAYTYRPWYLRQDDIKTDAYAEPNMSMAKWYGKNTIAVKQ